MKKLVMSIVIGLGLVVGFGSNVNACDDCSNEEIYMTYEQLCQFDQAIYEIYLEEYCTNLCEDCDTYYYKDCMCDACSSDCYGCIMYDYELFVEDNYDMIMNIYERVLDQLADYRMSQTEEETVIVIYEF